MNWPEGVVLVTQPVHDEDHGFEYDVPDESVAAILASAQPLPPFEQLVFDDLTDEQDHVFLETVLSA